MNTQFTEMISNYGNGPNQLETAISGLSDSDLDKSLTPKSWSIRNIVHHVADGDDIWKTFIKQAIGSPGGEFNLAWYWQIPQDEWAAHWDYQGRAIAPSLALFRANREHIVQLLNHSAGAMEKSLRIRWPEEGEQNVSIGWVVKMQTGHVTGHVSDIVKIREAHGI